VTLGGGLSGEHFVDETTPRGGLNQIGPFSKKAPRMTPPGVALQFYCSHHPGGSFGEYRGQAASPAGALTSSGNAARATSTRAANADGSVMAISARFLRSTSTPAALRPWINRL